MMELSHSLTLNEEVLAQIAEAKRPVFVFEWLRFLDKVLIAAQKNDIKGCQKKLVEQLTNQINESPGPPARKLISRCLATLFSVGDTFLLFDTVNKCNDIIRNKDDCPTYLPTRLAAICCVGTMYEKLGRMMGRSYEETVQILLKSLRNAESQARCEIMIALEKICRGMGTAANIVVKDIYKAARYCMADRAMAVRCAAAQCLLEMVLHTSFLYTTELESLASLCFRAFDGSNYDVRCVVGKLLGVAVASTQQPPKFPGKAKLPSLEEVLGILMMGFLRGGIGFLKVGAGEMIKGASGVCREIRVGVTHAYVVFVQTMGSIWLERHVPVFLQHCLELVSNPKASSTHVDAVYSRKCVSFMLRSVLGHLLGEKAQAAACKELCQLLVRLMNEHDKGLEAGGGRDASQESLYGQHGIVCALQELGCIIQSLGTTASTLLGDPSAGIMDTVQSVLLHPAPAARLAAAWCLRCVVVAVPSQLTPLVDRCMERLESLKASAEAVSGYSATLAAAAGAARLCPLGIPHSKGKMIFNIAEDLLRSASQNSRLSLPRTQAGWLLVGSVMTLGTPVVRGLLHRMLLLWKISFPKSAKELESEKARGDAFTWQVTLEGRAGALASMHSFLAHCPELLTTDALRRILSPIESALTMLTSISGVVKSYGQHLKASAALVRQRLYETLCLLPPHSFEGSYNALLRILVAEFTLTENPANTTTSLLRAVCHADDRVILGSWLQETDHKMIEDQLQPNSAPGSGALEHDPTSLYMLLPEGDFVPGPLPLGVSVIDMSVSLFGLVFPHVAHKHRLQMLEHFAECIKQAKSLRQEAMQINVFTAVLCGMKGLAESKMSFGQDDVRKAAINLVMSALTHSNPVLRCAAGEALGRMAQVVGDSRFVAEVTQNSFDRLKSARDVVSRTGHSLALGCVHRYVGGMGSGQHLNTSVSILLALAQDVTSPAVQVWALHALSLIADSGGPMFRIYVEPTLSLALKLLLHVPPSSIDVLQCIGKLLSALITTVGPEMQGNTNSICTARSSFLCACSVMQDHEDPLVQAEATSCLQQLHMFAPRHVNLSSLVPDLCRTLGSPHLLLRRAAVACLRQLAQREAREICDHALTLVKETSAATTASGKPSASSRNATSALDRSVITDTGLPGVLFAMLDTETDRQLVADIQQCVTSMLQSLAEYELGRWLSLCKDVLTVNTDGNGGVSSVGTGAARDADNDTEADDDQSRFKAGEEPSTHPAVVPRWPTRVFAAESVRKIIAACDGHRDHFDLTLARERMASGNQGNFLVLHLSDLIRVAFMAATSDSDQLRLEGLKTLQLVIDKFAHVPEPEFPGHVILEQYQAQVGAALRPAFSADTPPHVTAAACQVCSAWIGSGVARDLNDLRRVHQLLVTSLSKLKGCASSQLFNESTATLEKLAILKAWAEVYVVAMSATRKSSRSEGGDSPSESDRSGDSDADSDADSLKSCSRESLLELVAPELPVLSRFWLAALKDHALLSLPAEFVGQLPPNGGAFYSMDTMDSARPHYRASWPSMVRATALWLDGCGFEGHRNSRMGDAAEDEERTGGLGDGCEETNVSRFHLVFGICLEALCSPRSMEPLDTVVTCLHSLHTLLDSTWSRSVLGQDTQLCIELCNVLHRLLLTRECLSAQLLVMDVVRQVVRAAQEELQARRRQKLREMGPANQEPKGPDESLLMAEGGSEGDIVPGKSLVFAVLEVCLCVLVRQMPSLNPSLPVIGTATANSMKNMGHGGLSAHGAALVATALGVMTDMPALCSPAGSVTVLPSILFLLTGTLKETARDGPTSGGEAGEPVSTALRCLKTLAAAPYTRDERCCAEWAQLLQSALAKVLDITKTGPDKDGKVDEVSMLLAVATFLLNAPPHAVCVPNLRYPCLNLFKQAFESDSVQVRLKALETIRAVFQHPERSVSTPYVHALAPGIVEHLCGPTASSPASESELLFTIECMNSIETLVAVAEPQNRIDMMGLAVPVLVRLLRDDCAAAAPPGTAATWATMVHEAALRTLMRIGPKYPAEFRLLMTSAPRLRMRLEGAVRESQKQSRSTEQRSPSSNSDVAPQPSIQLKTDFSHFTG